MFIPNCLHSQSFPFRCCYYNKKNLVKPFTKQTFTMAIVRACAREPHQAENGTKSTKRERERFATKGTRAGKPCRMQGGVSNWPVRLCVSACVYVIHAHSQYGHSHTQTHTCNVAMCRLICVDVTERRETRQLPF